MGTGNVKKMDEDMEGMLRSRRGENMNVMPCH